MANNITPLNRTDFNRTSSYDSKDANETSVHFGHRFSNFISDSRVKAIATIAGAIALGVLAGLGAASFTPGALIVGAVAFLVGGGVLLIKTIEKGISILNKSGEEEENEQPGRFASDTPEVIKGKSQATPHSTSYSKARGGITRHYD